MAKLSGSTVKLLKANSNGRAPKMPKAGPGVNSFISETKAQRSNRHAIVRNNAEEARVTKIHAAGAAASKRAQARAKAGGGSQHRDRKGRFA
jgi:hypothetical protein